MTVIRFFKKIFFHFTKHIIYIVNMFDPRAGMILFNKLLLFVGVKLNGVPRFISTNIRIDTFNLIELGDRVVISEKVILLTHDYTYTTALISIGEIPKTDLSINRKIIIGNNVFIGMGSIVLPGTKIGDNVIVGAGSVVRGNVAENSVYIGNPGKIIGTIQEYALKCKTRLDSKDYLFHIDVK